MAFALSFLASRLGLELEIFTPGEAQAISYLDPWACVQALPTAWPRACGVYDPAIDSHQLGTSGYCCGGLLFSLMLELESPL